LSYESQGWQKGRQEIQAKGRQDGQEKVSRTVAWFSCGAASAVAARLTCGRADFTIAYCETGQEHEDNPRFLADCERWFGQPVERLHSDEYADTWDVWERTRWLAGIQGSRCTIELKLKPRITFQQPDDIHVFGYTCDANDTARAERLRANYPELRIETPLIERGITKAATLAMVENAGIVLPVPYRLGFQNNNCKTCVKATSPDYWSLVRQSYPADFERMAKLSRELDVRLARIDGERIFIDQIPPTWPTVNPIAPSCDFLCAIAEQDMHET
jgi:hypothetical protein